MTIGNMKVLAERLFKLKAARQALLLRLPGDELLRSLGTDDTQPLSFFGVEVRQNFSMLVRWLLFAMLASLGGKLPFMPGDTGPSTTCLRHCPRRGASSCCRTDQRSSYPQRMLRLVRRRHRPRSRNMLRFMRGGWTSNSRQALRLTVKLASVGTCNGYQPPRTPFADHAGG